VRGFSSKSAVCEVVLAVLAVVCSWGVSTQAAEEHAAAVVQGIQIPGEISAADAVWVGRREVHWKFRGDVIREIVPEGTFVHKGDFLLSVETNLWERERDNCQGLVKRREAELAGAEARLSAAQADLEATKKKAAPRLQPLQLAVERLRGLPDPIELSAARSDLELRLAHSKEARRQVEAVDAMVESQAEARQAVMEARLAADIAAADADVARAELSEVEQGAESREIEIAESELAMARMDADLDIAEKSLAVERARLDVRGGEYRLSLAQREVDLWEGIIAGAVRTAPADGFVAYEKTYVGSGQFEKVGPGVEVGWGERICSIFGGRAFRFRGRAGEGVLGRIHAGQTARVTLSALPEQVLTGRVTSLDVASAREDEERPAVAELESPRPKEFEVLIEIDNPPDGLLPGLGGEATIVADATPEGSSGRSAHGPALQSAPDALRFAGAVEPVRSTAVLTHNSVAGTIIRLAPQYSWLNEGDAVLETNGYHTHAYVKRAEDPPKFARAELEQLRRKMDNETSRWRAEVRKAQMARKVAGLRLDLLRAQPGPHPIAAEEARLRRAEIERERARQRLALAREAGLDSVRELQAKELAESLADLAVREAEIRLAKVKAGAPAARIREAELDLEEAEGKLAFAEAMADKMASVTEAELAVAQAAVADADEESQHYKDQYEYRIVRAPVAGSIMYNPYIHYLRKRVSIGDDLPASVQCVGYIVDLSRLKFCAVVEEPYLGRVAIGDKARVELLAFPGRAFDGEVLSVVPLVTDREEILSTMVDAPRLSGVRAARVDVLVELPQGEELRVLPGMTGTVELAAARTGKE